MKRFLPYKEYVRRKRHKEARRRAAEKRRKKRREESRKRRPLYWALAALIKQNIRAKYGDSYGRKPKNSPPKTMLVLDTEAMWLKTISPQKISLHRLLSVKDYSHDFVHFIMFYCGRNIVHVQRAWEVWKSIPDLPSLKDLHDAMDRRMTPDLSPDQWLLQRQWEIDVDLIDSWI